MGGRKKERERSDIGGGDDDGTGFRAASLRGEGNDKVSDNFCQTKSLKREKVLSSLPGSLYYAW